MTKPVEQKARELLEQTARDLLASFDNPEIQYVTFERDGENWMMRRFTRVPENTDGERIRREALDRAAKVADYAIERAERDWRNTDKQDAVKQVGAEIAEVIRSYKDDPPLSTPSKGAD